MAGLYTYGAPRVGNKQFEEIFNARFQEAYRVVNQDDVVPHLPPEFLGFSHTGQRVLFERNGTRREDRNTWKKFQAMMGGWIADLTKAKITVKEPHQLASSAGYLNQLKRDLEKMMDNFF